MDVRLLQCPACGSALTAGRIGSTMTCDYCGARLEIRQGASGAPLAKLSEIKVDTSFLAKERVRERLARKMQELNDEADRLRAEGNARMDDVSGRMPTARVGIVVGIIGWLLAGFVIGSGGWGLVIGIAVGAIFNWVMSRREDALREPIRRQYQERVDALEGELDILEREVRRLDEELDSLSREV